MRLYEAEAELALAIAALPAAQQKALNAMQAFVEAKAGDVIDQIKQTGDWDPDY